MSDRYGYIGIETLLKFCESSVDHSITPNDFMRMERARIVEPHWIPVTEKLPEDGKWCLFTDGVSMSVERYKADALDHFFPEGRWFRLRDAVAWMPLPEPYQWCDNCTDCVGECQEGSDKCTD